MLDSICPTVRVVATMHIKIPCFIEELDSIPYCLLDQQKDDKPTTVASNSDEESVIVNNEGDENNDEETYISDSRFSVDVEEEGDIP